MARGLLDHLEEDSTKYVAEPSWANINPMDSDMFYRSYIFTRNIGIDTSNKYYCMTVSLDRASEFEGEIQKGTLSGLISRQALERLKTDFHIEGN